MKPIVYIFPAGKVRYQPGTLEANRYDDAMLITFVEKGTAGRPTHMELSLADMPLRANREDLEVVIVALQESSGRLVPTAHTQVYVSIAGPAKQIGSCNGNPNDHMRVGELICNTLNGLALGVVRARVKLGYRNAVW